MARRPGTLYYIHADHLGTPRQVTHSVTNAVVWEWFGEPFGTSVPDEDPGRTGKKFTLNLRYAGQYFDKESNLFHNGFRDYDPQIGRYLESDPIGLGGGINTYSYVGGNPISRVDPFGEDWRNTAGQVAVCIACLFGGNRVPAQTTPPPRPVQIIPKPGACGSQ